MQLEMRARRRECQLTWGTELGPAIVEDKTSAEQDEIRELKALMDELQTSAGAV